MSGNKVQTQNLPDIPSPQDIVDSSGKKVSQAWREWFYALRIKVNSITGNIINLIGLTGTGFVVQTGTGTYANRKLVPGTGITIVNPDGVLGDITISSASASPLTTKGDLYTYTTGNARLPVGSDTYVLTASSVASTGLAWAPAGTPSLPVTTKGDLLGFNTVAARVPIGTDGYLLTADSTNSLGVSWQPSGGSLPAWTTVTYNPGWASFGSGYAPVSYYKDSLNIVRLRGLCSLGSGAAFTLPSSCRPEYTTQLAISSATANASITISTAGVVTLNNVSTYASFDQVTFRAYP